MQKLLKGWVGIVLTLMIFGCAVTATIVSHYAKMAQYRWVGGELERSRELAAWTDRFWFFVFLGILLLGFWLAAMVLAPRKPRRKRAQAQPAQQAQNPGAAGTPAWVPPHVAAQRRAQPQPAPVAPQGAAGGTP